MADFPSGKKSCLGLNDLPDNILIHILSFLPTTRSRIQTSLLSKRWRHLWISGRFLDFVRDETYSLQSLEQICFLYPHPTLTRLRIWDQSIDRTAFAYSDKDLRIIRNLPLDHFDLLLRFAGSRSVDEIILCFGHPFPSSFSHPRIPQSLVQFCSQTLTTLKIANLCFPKLPLGFTGFPILKTLHFDSVLFTNSDALSRLFSSCCPSLESLILEFSQWYPNVTVTPPIFPNLVKLKFVHCLDRSPQNLCTEAPELRYFYFKGAIECLHLRNCPRLRVAIIQCSGTGLLSCRRLVEIAEVLVNVEVLLVGYWFFPHLRHWHPDREKLVLCKDVPQCTQDNYPLPIFKNLKEFHCHGILLNQRTLRALLLFVCKCPSLEELCINLDFYIPELPELDYREEINCSENKNFVDIFEDYDRELKYYRTGEKSYARLMEEKELLCRRQLGLKTVTVTQFSNDRIYMLMLKFLLGKSPALELLQVNFIQDPHVMLESLQEEIDCFPRASKFAKVELSETELSNYDSCCRDKCSPLNHLWSF